MALADEDPAFVTVDRYDGATKAGATISWLNIDAAGEGGQRLELYGQYITPRGLGGYAAGSVARATSETGEDITTMGNLELGGLWASEHIPFRTVMRGGVVLATAGDGVDDVFANTQAIYPRVTDLSHITGNVTWARLSLSPRHRRGQGFFRIDTGLDIPLAGDGKDDASTLLRVNLAAGLNTGTTAAMIELVNLALVSNRPAGTERMWHGISLGARYLDAGPFEPSVALVLPIDGPGSDALNWALLLGAEYEL